MILKEFKHKKTGEILRQGVLSLEGYYVGCSIDIRVPARFVEDSEDWEEMKMLTFRSEDGIYMLPGQTMHAIYAHDLSDYGAIEVREVSNYTKTLLYFSSKEARDEYLTRNKRLLSIEDIKKSWVITQDHKSGYPHVHGSQTLEKLIELVASRL